MTDPQTPQDRICNTCHAPWVTLGAVLSAVEPRLVCIANFGYDRRYLTRSASDLELLDGRLARKELTAITDWFDPSVSAE